MTHRITRRLLVVIGVFVLVGSVSAAAAPDPGFRTSHAAMITPVAPGATVEPLLTVGDTLASGYRMESIPDGTSVWTRSDGNVDVWLNHETSLVPFPYNASTGVGSSDSTNAMLSHLVLSQHGAGVLQGSYAIDSSANYQRFCSNFLAVEGDNGNGFERSLLFTNEEASDFVNRTGPAWPPGPGAEQAGLTVALDPQTGAYRPIYGMGRMNHENSVAVAGYEHPVLLTGDDTFSAPSSQLYMYSAATANAVWNDQGSLWAFTSDVPTVNDYSDLTAGTSVSGRFIEVPRSIAVGGQTALENWSNANNVFQFIRVEDITTDRNSPNVVYFADTGEPRALPGPGPLRMRRGPSGTTGPYPNGRVFKMVLSPVDPTQVLSLSTLVEGDPNGAASVRDVRFIHNPDNVETTEDGLLIQEDPGSQNYYAASDPNGTTARIWYYSFATQALSVVAKVDQSADPSAKQGEWESSGIVSASDAFGDGTFLVVVQAHTILTDKHDVGKITFKREGGQLLLFHLPDA